MKTAKLFFSLLFVFGMLNQMFCGNGTEADPIRIFWIGNSNSYMWGWYPNGVDMAADPDMPRIVQQMALKAARPIYMEYEFEMHGGASLKDQWGYGANDRIASGNFDFVVLNDHSTATFAYYDQFREYSEKFDSLTTAHGGRAVFYMSWPDDDEWSLRRDVIISSYDTLASDLGCELAPLGRAWEIIEQNHPSIDMYQDDDHHPNELGVYMNSCVCYSVITNQPPVYTGHKYAWHWVSPTNDDLYAIQNAAWQASRERLDADNEMSLTSTIVNQRDIQLDWINPESATTSLYAIYDNATFIDFTTSTTYTISDAKPEIKHNIVVKGMDSDTTELYNSKGETHVLTDVDAPSVPQNTRIFAEGDDYVHIVWDESTDNGELKEYIVYLNDAVYVVTDEHAIPITGLQLGNTYKIEIVAVDNADNTSLKSTSLTFTLGGASILNESEQKFFMYPNPAYNSLNVISQVGSTLSVFSLSGSLCMQTISNESETILNVSDLLPGTYIISVSSEYGRESKRLIVE